MTHYNQAAVFELATDIGDGWRESVLTLAKDDTAWSALSSKWDFRGPGKVVYLIHRSGIEVRPDDTIKRRYR